MRDCLGDVRHVREGDRGPAALSNPSPSHMVMEHNKFASVAPWSNPCTQLHGAVTWAPRRYGGSSLAIFTEETKGN